MKTSTFSKYIMEWFACIIIATLIIYVILSDLCTVLIGIPPSDDEYTEYYKATVVAIDPEMEQIRIDGCIKWQSILYLDEPKLEFGNFKCKSTDVYSIGDTVYLKCIPGDDICYKIITEDEYYEGTN